MRIGVDVGGTNTDAVVMQDKDVLAAVKTPTTADVSTGIVLAVREALAEAEVDPRRIAATMIGTTQFTNAFVERKRLREVGVIRVSLPSNTDIRPMLDWPEKLVSVVGEHAYWAHGGYEFDGSEIAPFCDADVRKAARDIKRKGLRHVAISCVFSPVNAEEERCAAEIVKEEIPEAHITLSSEIGRIGMIERENASIMNAALIELSTLVVGSFRKALESLDITAPFFISQNDGTLMGADYVERYPVLTFASGPTNSMRGAAFLSGLKDAIVVDVGGTTTDVGVLANGFPRESAVPVDIGGVRTNFRMPDILAVGLGGGSCVRRSGEGVTVGPDSVGYELTQKALVFGGDTLTATDIAVAAGQADFGDRAALEDLEPGLIKQGLGRIRETAEDAIDRMKTSAEAVPIILVGGGSILIGDDLSGASNLVRPDHAGVANAIGAAMAQVGGETDRVFSYDAMGRDGALEAAKAESVSKAIDAGADPASVQILDVEEIPMAYMPGGSVRVRAKAVGDLVLDGGGPSVQ